MSTRKNLKPPPEIIKAHLSYDPETGEFHWSPSHRLSGRRAGYLDKNGYWGIRFKDRYYLACHLAWWFVYGEWPTCRTDHENLNPSDDRIVNLRLATSSQNIAHAARRRNNTSGFRGVCFVTRQKRWMAYATKDRRHKFIGFFDVAEEAARARDAVVKVIYGQFAHLNFPTPA